MIDDSVAVTIAGELLWLATIAQWNIGTPTIGLKLVCALTLLTGTVLFSLGVYGYYVIEKAVYDRGEK